MAVHDPIMIARFWSKVAVLKAEDECWLWTASTSSGYGHMKSKGTMFRSNRLAWEIFNDEPLGNRQALHKCDNRACCNPMHIYAGTAAQNSEDVHVRNRRLANKLSVEDVRHIRTMLARGVRQSEIAEIFKVGRGQISKIHNGRSWNYET